MNRTTPQSMKEDFKKQFGACTSDDRNSQLSLQQLWLIVKLCKYVRLRARNNAAFNNLFNQVFPYANFSQVNKLRLDKTTGHEVNYPGLEITLTDGTKLSMDETE